MKIEAIQAVSSGSVLSNIYAEIRARADAVRARQNSLLGDSIPGAVACPPATPPTPRPGLAEVASTATTTAPSAMSGVQVLHALEALAARRHADRSDESLATSHRNDNSFSAQGSPGPHAHSDDSPKEEGN
jgi:hypothetical protein